jgi:hypothetical protein
MIYFKKNKCISYPVAIMHDGANVIWEVISVDFLVRVFLEVPLVPRAYISADNKNVLISVWPRLFMYKAKGMPKLMSNTAGLKEQNQIQPLRTHCWW